MKPQDLCVKKAYYFLPFVKECFKIEFDAEPNYKMLKHLLLKALLSKEMSPNNIFDWSNFEQSSPNPRSRMWEIQLDLRDEETEDLSEHFNLKISQSQLIQANNSILPQTDVFCVDTHMRSYRMKPKMCSLWFRKAKGKLCDELMLISLPEV